MNKKLTSMVLCVSVLLAALAGCAQLPPAAPPAAPPPAAVALTAAPPSPTPGPFPGLTEWDLLVIADDTNWGVGQAYAKLIEADMGVKVKLYDCTPGGMPITDALAMIDGTSKVSCGGKWPDMIRDAEVIVLEGNPMGSKPVDGAWGGDAAPDDCVLGTYASATLNATKLAAFKANLAKNCAPETYAKYRADLSAVIDGIFKVRAGRPVILRMTDYYVPSFKGWDNAGVRDACMACMDNFVQAVHQVAAEYGVPVGSSMDALVGTDRGSDATERGYINKVDGSHLTVAGAQRVAEALQQTGYAYSSK